MATEFKTACVTGGAGFIGSHLVRALLARGLQVTVIDNLSVGRRENVPDEVEFIHGDILDPEIAAVAARSDVVFHMAARVAIRSSFEFITEDVMANVVGTANLLRAVAGAPEGQVKRFLFASSMAIYADAPGPTPISESSATEPISPYGVSKLAAERLVHQVCGQAGIDACVLRLFNTYGPGQAYSPYVGVVTIFSRKMEANETPTIFGDGEQRRDFVHVDDIVQGFVRAMDRGVPGATYNIGSGTGVSVNELYARVARALGFSAAAKHDAAVPGEVRYSIADISRARGDLGYQPSRKFDEAIEGVVMEVTGR